MKTKDALGRRSRKAPPAPLGKPFKLSANDLRILNLLKRYRWLPSDWILALLGTTSRYYIDRLTTLRHEAGLIYCPEDGWGHNIDRQPAVYGLTDKGEKLVGKGIKLGNKVRHDLLACLCMASIELGAIEAGYKVYDWEEYRTRKNLPPEWRVRLDDRRVLEPDWPPRAIGLGKFFYIWAMEADRYSETLNPLNSDPHKSIRRMFEDYFEVLSITKNTPLGIPRPLVLIITTDATHKRSMMEVLTDVAGARRCDNFLFTNVEDILTQLFNFPKPGPELFNRVWETTKGPYSLAEKLKEVIANGRQTQPHSGTEEDAGRRASGA